MSHTPRDNVGITGGQARHGTAGLVGRGSRSAVVGGKDPLRRHVACGADARKLVVGRLDQVLHRNENGNDGDRMKIELVVRSN